MTPRYHYSLTIEWDPRSDVFVVTVPELPGCRTHGRTYAEALTQAEDAIEGWLEVQETLGRPVPEPRVFATAS